MTKPGSVALPVVSDLVAVAPAGESPSFGSSVWKKKLMLLPMVPPNISRARSR